MEKLQRLIEEFKKDPNSENLTEFQKSVLNKVAALEGKVGELRGTVEEAQKVVEEKQKEINDVSRDMLFLRGKMEGMIEALISE